MGFISKIRFLRFLCCGLCGALCAISSFVLPVNGHAQQNTPFDFLEASRKAIEADRALQKINSTFGRLTAAPNCDKVTSVNGETVMSCSLKPEDYNTPIVKIDYDADKIPEKLKPHLPVHFVNDVRGKKVSCVYRFKIQNDNQLGRGVNLEGPERSRYGDDYGNTHGMDTSVSCASEDGVSNAFIYSTTLFSNPDASTLVQLPNGNASLKQTFTSENVFEWIQDDINQGKATYWKVGAGFINHSGQKKWGLLQSTGQQQWFHSIVNSIRPGTVYEYDYVDSGKDRWGAFVTLAIGLQENRKLGDRCQLNLSADVGTRLSTLKGTTSVNANAQMRLDYQVTDESKIYLKLQSSLNRQNAATIKQDTAALGYEHRKGLTAEVGATAQKGNRTDVPDLPNWYTKKNDLLFYVLVGYKY